MDRKHIDIKSVDRSEALRYMGCSVESLDDNMNKLLDVCEEQLLKNMHPAYIYRVFDLDDNFNLVNCDFKLEGKDIKKHLNNCEKAVLMCVTLSSDVDKLIRIKQIGDMAQATIIDSMASAAVEQVCNKVEQIIKEEIDRTGQYSFTWRYGLGYGDLPLEGQRQFLNVLDAPKKIGVCVSDSYMLVPTKSVTCIIGVGQEGVNKEKKSCENCNFKDKCRFRKKGEHCGS